MPLWAQPAAIVELHGTDESSADTSARPPATSPRSTSSSGQRAVNKPLSTATGSLEQRVQKLERMLNGQALVNMLRNQEEVESVVQMLRGEVDELRHEIENIKRRQRDIYLDVDRRMQQLESGASEQAAGATPGGEADMTPSVTAGMPGPAAGNALAEQNAYDAAIGLLQQGDYDQALTAFKQFTTDYPQSQYAANAQYWLGEANYVMRRFSQAEKEFKTLLDNYAASNKVPDAMLKLGFTYYELGEWQSARQILTRLRNDHPDSTAARLAKERLQRMDKEGR
jgi:tol-pal system protein YbgF